MLNRVSVSEGQTVAVGAALFEVANLDTIWIRVPVFVDMLDSIDREREAQLVSLGGGRSESAPVAAQPIVAPPTADALSSSADVYYEVDNRSLGLRPGQRIGVELPLAGRTEALVVPAAAILYDIYGGTWVYTISGERQYTRSRVRVGWVDGNAAALTTGLALVPLVVTGEIPGQEIEYPMALVILCGLAGATIVNLLVLPILCSFAAKAFQPA